MKRSALGLLFSLSAGLLLSSPLGATLPSACTKFGGTLSIHTEFKLCSLGKAKVEEGTLELHILKKQPQDALRLFLERPMPRNLAGGDAPGQYCDQLGGSTDILKLKNKDEVFFCLFGDGSSIEQWTLFKGPRHADNAQLIKALPAAKVQKK